ncbi:MAG: hypothetical protein K2X86_06895 [Cytophagaceae bacterium]|nr:hypothetical protein [Cytophagaceae bacterium]
MKRYKLLFLYALLCVLASCDLKGIAVPADKMDYIGEWESPSMELYIGKDGSVKYERIASGRTTKVSGPIQKFEGDNFVVGALGMNTTFNVSRKPHEENGIWKMTVDGEDLTRQ